MNNDSTRGPWALAVRRTVLLAGWIALVATILATPRDDAMAAGWAAQLRTTAYFRQIDAGDGETEDSMPFYEHYDLSASQLLNGRVDARVSGRFANDLALDQRVTDRERIYVAYAGARLDRYATRVRVGRQFLQEGTYRMTLDGAWLTMKPMDRLEVHGWAGAKAPASRILRFGDRDDGGSFGMRVVGSPARNLRLGAWWAQRRLDGELVAQPLGGEIAMSPMRGVRALIRGAYETESEELERFDLLTQLRPWPELPALTVQFVDRRPTIETNSYFYRWADDVERIRLLRASTRHVRDNGMGGEVEFFTSSVDDQRSTRFGIAFLAPYVRVGTSFRVGDRGEQTRFYGDVHWSPREWVDLRAGATMAEYALVDDPTDDETRDLVTAYARARFHIRDGVKILTELQSLENPFYSEDVRILIGLDLAMGRGPSRFGWGAGGER